MSAIDPKRLKGSLVERVAEMFDLGTALQGRPFEGIPEQEPRKSKPAPAPVMAEPSVASEPPIFRPAPAPVAPNRKPSRPAAIIDRDALAKQGLLIPGAPIGTLAEEFRLVKRQLLLTKREVKSVSGGIDKSRVILVCSAQPNDGKTFCAINLALSMAAEKDMEVLLVDGDFAKPDVLKVLGVPEGPGLLDVLADPSLDVENCVVPTDIPQLSLLPAGAKSESDVELIASERTREVLNALLVANPRRLVIFDSPPALAASPASVLALQAGQVMLVVRADRTGESDLREAVSMLDGCEHISLVLNSVALTPGGRRFGDYYGYGYGQGEKKA